MSKGTKQIRYGKVERKLEELELLLRVKKQGAKIPYLGQYDYGYYQGWTEALELVIEGLKELGAPPQSVERGADEGEMF